MIHKQTEGNTDFSGNIYWMLIEVSEEDLRSTKEFLLKNNPSKINEDNQSDILNKFVECFRILFAPLANQTEGLSDPLRLLIIDSLSVWILRSSQIISSDTIDNRIYLNKVQEELLTSVSSTIIFRYVVDFWTDAGSAFVNALRDMFKKLLHLLKMIYASEKSKNLFTLWLNQTLQIPSTLRVKYYLIDALAGELDLYTVLKHKSDFVETSMSLMWSDSLSNPIGKCITSLLMNVYEMHLQKDTAKIANWLHLWQKPALYYLRDHRYKKAILLYILNPLFREMPNIAFISFVQNVSTSDSNLLITLFKLGQELGIEEEPFQDDRLISLENIETFLQEDESKLPAFELLTFSAKKSRPVNAYIFKLIQRNLNIFFVDNEIETRNYFCSTFKHFILRIRDSAYSLNRSVIKLKKANKFPIEQQENEERIAECEKFLLWFVQYLKVQICPGTQYQRNDLAFKLLKILVESGIDNSVLEQHIDMRNRREYPFSISLFTDISLLRLLIENLKSNYDDIRESAKELLAVALNSSNGYVVRNEFDWEAVSHQANKYLKVYQTSEIGAAVQNVLFYTSKDKLLFINNLIELLKNKLSNSKHNYMKHLNDPIGGYFMSLSMILKEAEFTPEENDAIIRQCLSLVFDNWEAVKTIVCYDSSEEHRPAIFIDCNIEDQVIITNAFRSIKESSALLNTILSRYALSEEQLTVLGDLLIHQLFSIRHSGAFQSVLPSFQTCCIRCCQEYPSQLKTWLEGILASLEVKTQNITRRSGGIPFLLSIIFTTEKGKERPLLKYAFENLERIASAPIGEHQDKVDLPQINAFNCIRAIFIESKLSEPCALYVPSALSLSLRNFTSDIWALRNCSIMLFTSLQNRLFGKYGKNVSARLFFTRYQGIRESLLDILQLSIRVPSGDVENTGSHPQSHLESIFLVLNLLSRLKPTPGYDGLNAFIIEVTRCLENSNWKIREMASRTIASLIEEPYEKSAILLKSSSIAKQNKLHGVLLAVNHLIQVSAVTAEHNKPFSDLIDVIFEKEPEFLTCNPSYVTAKAYVQLVNTVLNNRSFKLPEAKKCYFISSLGHFFLQHSNRYSIDGSKQLCLASVLNTLVQHEESMQLVDICHLGILSPFYEVQKIAIQFFIDELDLTLLKSEKIIDEIENLLGNSDLLPTISSLIIKALEKAGRKISIGTLLDLIETPNNEELQLSAIVTLGNFISQDNTPLLEMIVLKYSQDDMPTDFRLASVNCFKNYRGASDEARLILQMHKMLSDDDINVRHLASQFLNNIFFVRKTLTSSTSPSVIAANFGPIFANSFPELTVGTNASRLLKQFFNAYDIFLLNYDEFEGLFELEEDNQYRNHTEENFQYINILKISNYQSIDFSNWVCDMKEKLFAFLHDHEFKDGPLGWASNPAVFSRLCVLRALLNLYDESQIAVFDAKLKDRQIHPLVFDYASICNV